jgi:tetratricopeptide (TPR) repeat protein
VHHDLQIGLGAAPQLAWAILPSKGEVQFAPSGDAGAALVASVGTAISTSSTDWDDPKFGEDKTLASAASLLSSVTIGGAEVTASIEIGRSSSRISSSQKLDSSASWNYADRYYHWVVSEVGEVTLDGSVRSTSSFDRGQFPNHQAIVGANLLAQTDIAADPASSTLAISAAAENHWKSQVDHHLEAAHSALKDSSAEESKEGEDSGPDVGSLKNLASAYEAAGQLDKAVETWSQVTEAKAEDCSHWLSLGQAQQNSGNADAAIESFNKSSELYHSWWDLDLETRAAISEYRSASESEKFLEAMRLFFLDDVVDINGNSTLIEEALDSQAGSCHVADGALAAAHLAVGDTDTVASLYSERLDLDPGLAQAQGTARLSSGDIQGAHAALRQAMIRESKPQANSRLGLAMAYTADGDWNTAESHYLKALYIDSGNSVLAAAWVDAKVNADGSSATLKAAEQWAASRPYHVAAQYAQVRAAWHAGDANALSDGVQKAEGRMNYISAQSTDPVHSLTSLARVRSLAGNAEGAMEAAKKAIDLDPSSGAAWLALADAQAASMEDNADALARASTIDPLTPGLGEQVLEIVVEEEVEGEVEGEGDEVIAPE